jgi:4-oxalocrotonate tautomerase
MPLVRVSLVAGATTTEEQAELRTRITDATESVLGPAVRPYTWVMVEELDSGAWAIGGNALTTEAVLAMRGTAAAAT